MKQVEVIGLTGGIGSGKSTVAEMLRRRGCAIIDADQLAREVVAHGSEGLSAIVETFSSVIVTSSGELDRAKLREIVFRDAGARKRLNEVMHPRIRSLMELRKNEFGERGFRWVVYEAALLVETGAYRELGALVVVYVDEEEQCRRVSMRDGVDLESARRIVDAQISMAEKVAVADYVVENVGSLEELDASVEEAYVNLVGRFGAPQW